MVVTSWYRIDFASIQSVRPGARTVTVKLRCSTCFGWEGGGGGGGRRDGGGDGRRDEGGDGRRDGGGAGREEGRREEGGDGRRDGGKGWLRDGGEGWWDVCWRDADARDGPAPLS